MNRVWTVVVSILFMGVVLSLATIPDVSVPNTFTSGTKAVASEVNANFDTLELYHNNLLDSLRARLKIDTIDAKYFDTVRSAYGDFTLFDTVRATYGDFTLFDTVRATYGDFTLFDTVRATYGDFTLFDTVRATYGDFTLFDTVRATYGDFTLFDTVRATYGDFALQDSLKSNVIKGDSLTYIGNDTTRFKITKAGNVGIGTTVPLARTHIRGVSVTPTTRPGGILIVSDGTALAADIGGSITFEGVYNSTGNYTDGAAIRTGKDNATDGNYGYYLAMHTRTHASATMDERVRITSTGNVGIDTTTPASKLHVAGSVRVRDTVICGTWNPTTVNATTVNATTVNSNILKLGDTTITGTATGDEYNCTSFLTRYSTLLYTDGNNDKKDTITIDTTSIPSKSLRTIIFYDENGITGLNGSILKYRDQAGSLVVQETTLNNDLYYMVRVTKGWILNK